MLTLNGQNKWQGKASGDVCDQGEATAKTRRHKHSPEAEGCKDIPQILLDHPFSGHVMLKTGLRFKTE